MARIIIAITAIVTLAACSHKITGIQDGTRTVEDPTWRDCFYLSIMTMTTVGFGDVTPTTRGRSVAGAQAIAGYLSMGVFIAAALDLMH